MHNSKENIHKTFGMREGFRHAERVFIVVKMLALRVEPCVSPPPWTPWYPRFLFIPPFLNFQDLFFTCHPSALPCVCVCLVAERHASRLPQGLELLRAELRVLLSPPHLAWLWNTALGMRLGVAFRVYKAARSWKGRLVPHGFEQTCQIYCSRKKSIDCLSFIQQI